MNEAEGVRDLGQEMMDELVRLRQNRRIGQKVVARAIGVSQGRISQLESQKGRITLDAFISYARAIAADISIVTIDEF